MAGAIKWRSECIAGLWRESVEELVNVVLPGHGAGDDEEFGVLAEPKGGEEKGKVLLSHIEEDHDAGHDLGETAEREREDAKREGIEIKGSVMPPEVFIVEK